MSDILDQLAQLFLQSIPTVILVFVLLAVLERLLFRPLTAILKQREEATVGALARAREQAAAAEAKSREYEATFQAVRQESYRLREEERRAALGEREETLRRTRVQMESRLKEAQASFEGEVGAARQELARASQSLATKITEAVLSASPPVDRPGGVRA